MEIKAKVYVYRVDQTKKGEWVQCRALVTFDNQQPMNCTLLRPVKESLAIGEHIGTFAVREREGSLALELAKSSAIEPARKVA